MLTTLFAALAVLMMGVSIPLAAQKIPPNRLYGFSTPRTVKDERVWYPVNRVAGRNGMVFGLFLGIAALLSFIGLLGWSLVPLAMLAFVASLASTFVSASQIVNRVDKSGPLIDYSSSIGRDRSSDRASEREKLMKKLRKE